MFGTHDVWLFVVSGLLLNVMPGPDTLYIIGRSSTMGWPAGAVAALGIGTGILVHIMAAALGLSALLAASATAFIAVKTIGAAYLIYVGISMLRSAPPRFDGGSASDDPPAALRRVFLQGFLTNVLNPKVALFFLAFLPQFVLVDTASKPLALLFLGAIFNVNGMIWNLAVAWSASHVSARLRRGRIGSAALRKWLNRAVGSVFVGVGIKLAFSNER